MGNAKRVNAKHVLESCMEDAIFREVLITDRHTSVNPVFQDIMKGAGYELVGHIMSFHL